MERISFYDQIARNKRNSILLTLFVGAIIIAIGYAISLVFPTEYVFLILSISIILGVFWPIISYNNSGKIAIWSVGAVPANRTQFKQYYDIVEGLTLASGLPMPKLYIMKGQQINAFASGKDPQSAVVCVTEGALIKLTKQELEGVLAHEMSHVANYDIRFMTLVSVLVGIISIMAQMFLRSLWLSDNRNNEGKNGGIFVLIGIVLAILAPIVTTLVQLAVSRKREYTADATAVKFTRTPTGLIGALSKIKNDSSEIKVSGSMAPLFFTKPNLSAAELFATHPPLEKRIEILKKM
ncbi:Protease HtpX [uncultured archaeon]|nr:Protease HtpX [uncultured archaeon]